MKREKVESIIKDIRKLMHKHNLSLNEIKRAMHRMEFLYETKYWKM